VTKRKQTKARTPSPPKIIENEHKSIVDDDDDDVSVESTPTLSSGSSSSASTPNQHSNHEIIPPLTANDQSGSGDGSVGGNRSDTPVPKNKKFKYVSNSDVHNGFSEDQEQEFDIDPLD